VIVVPSSRILCYCWTASLDGTIRYWDFSVPELMKKVDIKLPVYSMVRFMPCYSFVFSCLVHFIIIIIIIIFFWLSWLSMLMSSSSNGCKTTRWRVVCVCVCVCVTYLIKIVVLVS